MECPRDGMPLGECNFKNVMIDICPSCNGAWLDEKELALITRKKSDIPVQAPGEKRLLSSLKCPKCLVPMEISWYERPGDVEMDRCPRCQGIWLDTDEMKKILQISLMPH